MIAKVSLAGSLVLAMGGGVTSCRECRGLPSDTSAKIALETTVRTSANPPSRFYCGNVAKAQASPGGCASYATDGPSSNVPAVERTEIRGWVVSSGALHWVEDDEVGVDILLDWGWSPAANGITPLNTPDALVGAMTPHNVIAFGRNPTTFSGASSRLAFTNNNTMHAWGGQFAHVLHVELQAWRTRSDGVAMPAEWTVTKSRELNPDGGGTVTRFFTFPFDPFRPAAVPALARDLEVGDYVRIVGTRWEDSCHCRQGAYAGEGVADMEEGTEKELGRQAKSCWWTGSFKLGSVGRGWTEIHPMDYMSTFPHAGPDAPRAEKLETFALCGAGEFSKTVLLDPASKPAGATGVEYRKIDTPFTFQGDIENEEILVLPTGILVTVKLRQRGLNQGDPKYMSAFVVKWKTS